MATLMVKRFGTPDETRPFASKGRAEVVRFGEGAVARGVFEPGWRWSDCVKPIAKTESCEVEHAVYVLTGRMRIRMDDGAEEEIGPGDAAMIPPGHDAWVVGQETCTLVDFGDVGEYARPGAGAGRAAAEEEPRPPVH